MARRVGLGRGVRILALSLHLSLAAAATGNWTNGIAAVRTYKGYMFGLSPFSECAIRPLPDAHEALARRITLILPSQGIPPHAAGRTWSSTPATLSAPTASRLYLHCQQPGRQWASPLTLAESNLLVNSLGLSLFPCNHAACALASEEGAPIVVAEPNMGAR